MSNQTSDEEKNEQFENETDEKNEFDQGIRYTTDEGGQGMWYEPNQPPVKKKKKPSSAVKTVWIVSVAVILLVAIIATVAVNLFSRAFHQYLNAILSSNRKEERQSDDTGLNGTKVNIGEKLGDISVEKTEPLETVSQATGSAGDNALGSYAEVVALVKDSVVEISVTATATSSWGIPYVTSGAGSGVIISSDGYIVTNYHVIEGAETIYVTLTDGTKYSAVIKGMAESNDLALIQIEPTRELTVATLGCSADLVLGEEVLAIGNPLGSLGGTVTNGIISSTARSVSVDNKILKLLQTNAAINPGNSGGGLFNMAGQLIGIVNAKYTSEEVEGIGFAIPSDTVYDVICDLMEYGYVRGIPDDGLELIDVTSQITAYRYFKSTNTGVYVYNSTLSEDLKRGDRLVSVNGTEIGSLDVYKRILMNSKIGDELTFVIDRSGKKVEVTLTVQEYVPDYVKSN
ncbi:MAG: trypsin-like peptidase domain-containing protein [Clostridia bacterium]|nr:trypsin-like peptidase domain-containing protein [Clostridia bacterium]